MKKVGIAVLAAAGWLGAGSAARAATADGTLITNVACATFSSLGVPFAVSYCATAYAIVQNPCVALQKVANPTVQATGGTVTFTLWAVNCSASVSAFNVTVTDRLPDNVTYSGNELYWKGSNPGNTALFPANSTNNIAWVAGSATLGQGAPFYLRWQQFLLGPGTSSMVTFTVNVN